MIIKEIQADLIELIKSGEYDASAQSCNCFNTQGSGVALALKTSFPNLYEADCQTVRGDYNKLGNYTYWDYIHNSGRACRIFNLYTQYNYGKDGKLYAIYPAIELALMKMSRELKPTDKIVMPKISCNLAGAKWETVSQIINCALTQDVTICYL